MTLRFSKELLGFVETMTWLIRCEEAPETGTLHIHRTTGRCELNGDKITELPSFSLAAFLPPCQPLREFFTA